MAWTTLTLNSDGSQKRSNILAVGGKKIFCCVFVVVFLDDRRPFVRPMLSDRCLSVLSVCDIGVLWPNGCRRLDGSR